MWCVFWLLKRGNPSLVETQWVAEDVIRERKEGSLTQAECSVMFRVTKRMLGNVFRLGLVTRSSLAYLQEPGKAIRICGMLSL